MEKSDAALSEGKGKESLGRKLCDPKWTNDGKATSKAEEIKQISARLIDLLEDWRSDVLSARQLTRDEAMLITLAQQSVLTASMTSVKAVTYVAI